MNSPAVLKYIVDRWNDDEEIVGLLGNLHGEANIDESIKLPYARCAVECPATEIQTNDTFLTYYYLLFVIYGIQDSENHYLAGKALNKLFYGKNCRFDKPDNHITIMHILPESNKFELIDTTIAGRDVLVSEHRLKMLAQTNYLNPDD